MIGTPRQMSRKHKIDLLRLLIIVYFSKQFTSLAELAEACADRSLQDKLEPQNLTLRFL